MEPLRQIQKIEQMKVLGDSRRLVILQRLMAGPETLSTLGKALGEHPARVRHHLKILEKAGLVELVATQPVRGFVEKYYQAKAQAFAFNGLILPYAGKNGRETVVAIGSHDLALEMLAERTGMLTLSVGSLEGLLALRQGNATIAGCHLLDPDSGEYNLPFVKHFFPDRMVSLFTLCYREQGLIVAPGNPKGIRSLEDLSRPEITLANRIQGSGTRIWLDRQLQRLGIPTSSVRGYDKTIQTHTALAESIASGQADTGLGLRAAAQQAGLDFIPLFEERYDLVVPEEQLDNPALSVVLDRLSSGPFRKLMAGLGGYNPERAGERRRNE